MTRDPGAPDGVLGVTVRRPVGVFMVLLAVGLFGYASLGRLPLNLLPDLSYPSLTVRTSWEGAAPEEMEERVTRPLEEGLRVVPRPFQVEVCFVGGRRHLPVVSIRRAAYPSLPELNGRG